eukprot:2558032-Amphidinium_carterae.2
MNKKCSLSWISANSQTFGRCDRRHSWFPWEQSLAVWAHASGYAEVRTVNCQHSGAKTPC